MGKIMMTIEAPAGLVIDSGAGPALSASIRNTLKLYNWNDRTRSDCVQFELKNITFDKQKGKKRQSLYLAVDIYMILSLSFSFSFPTECSPSS